MQLVFMLKDSLDNCAHGVDRQLRRHGDVPAIHEPQPIVQQRSFFVADGGLDFGKSASKKLRRNEYEHIGKRIEPANLRDNIVRFTSSGHRSRIENPGPHIVNDLVNLTGNHLLVSLRRIIGEINADPVPRLERTLSGLR